MGFGEFFFSHLIYRFNDSYHAHMYTHSSSKYNVITFVCSNRFRLIRVEIQHKLVRGVLEANQLECFRAINGIHDLPPPLFLSGFIADIWIYAFACIRKISNFILYTVFIARKSPRRCNKYEILWTNIPTSSSFSTLSIFIIFPAVTMTA